ncbi:MAG: hypothetical protein Kapaf2KO_09760 [Candidatus Kapaibacteriales bacterium]
MELNNFNLYKRIIRAVQFRIGLIVFAVLACFFMLILLALYYFNIFDSTYDIISAILISSSIIIYSTYEAIKSLTLARFDNDNIYYVYKDIIICEPISNIREERKTKKTNSIRSIEFINKSSIGKKLQAIEYPLSI